jgi:hypothetical protein
MTGLQSGFGSARGLSSRDERPARAKRSSIWTMTPGCFRTTAVAATGAGGAGGAIFSNEKAGMVHPLVVELKHSRTSSGILSKRPAVQRLAMQIVFPCLMQKRKLEHNLCQIAAIAAAL